MYARVLACTVAVGLLSLAGSESWASNKKKPPIEKRRPTPIPTPKPAAPSGEETGALAGLTAEHNAARTAVGVAGLTWSTALAIYAQEWANQLAANGCQLAHRPNRPYGENLYWSSSPATAKSAVAMWTVESANYDAEAHTCNGTCGHYTQVVWANTTAVGCGMASCGQQQVWVCNYDPPGNVVGQHPF